MENFDTESNLPLLQTPVSYMHKINDKVEYMNSDGTKQMVTIIGVHLDAPPDIYYTIKYDDKDIIKQTISERLSSIKDKAVFKPNDKAKYYHLNGKCVIVKVIDIHYDNYPTIYYTIKFNNNKTKKIRYDKLFLHSS